MKARPKLFVAALPLVLGASLIIENSCAGIDSSSVRALFKNPPREYSTGPLWVWNDMLTEEQIRDTLRDLAGQKVKQVWVHPRPGLMTPYLADDWFRLWKVALNEAERLDMNVWIYDENSYPSGFAGGLVPEAMPESRGRGLVFRETNDAPKWSEDMIAVYRLDGTAAANVTAQVKAGQAMPEAAYLIASEARAANSPWHGNRCYVNLLSPGVTEKFLELTLEPYRREIGQEFGKRVPGVFTDEPNIRPAGGLPWSEILAGEFQKRWGYDLLEHLPSLTRPIGDWQRIRHNYFQLLNDQFIDHWSKPYHDYCETNHLEWTGHYWDHDWPHCVGVPDNMAMYGWHQRPSIDCLMNQFKEETHAQFGNVRMVKEVSSVANQLGMKRTLCEVYGAGGWDLRFEDMKRIGDWLEVLGVNTLNQHLSYVTIRGARKRDHPQSFSYHEPWWDAYHVSAEYLARVSTALSQGEQVNHVLVIEPTTTAWMYQGHNARLDELGKSFFQLLVSLEAAQVEYDIGCEDLLARHGSVSPKGLKIGQRDYQTVVVPRFTENLNAKTADLLAEFMRSAGKVLSCGEPPARINGNPSPQGAELAKSAGWKNADPSVLAKELATTGFVISRKEGDRGILFHNRRQVDDGELLFLVNTSIEQASAGVVESDLSGVERWDLYTGQVEPYPFEAASAGVKAGFSLPPSGSLLLFLSRKPLQPAPSILESVRVIKAEAPPEIRRQGPNVLVLDYVDIEAGGETRTNIYVYKANQFAWSKNGAQRDPWDSAVQFKNELISKTFPPESGFTATYKFTIESAVPKNLSVVVERPDLYAITCNGQALQPKSGEWWLDKSFGRIPLASCARQGENIVTIKAAPFTMYHELEAAYVLGDFAMKPTDSGFVIGPDRPLSVVSQIASSANGGSTDASDANRACGWNHQGHPFYAAGVVYSERFELKKSSGRYVVALPKWYGSVAQVTVNGRAAGIIDAPPWECDVTKWIKGGAEKIDVTIIGTLKNTLGPHHGNPALGAAWPSAFQKAPEFGPPPGTNYSTVAYGLFEPFVLKQISRTTGTKSTRTLSFESYENHSNPAGGMPGIEPARSGSRNQPNTLADWPGR